MIDFKKAWSWKENAEQAFGKAFKEAKTDLEYYEGEQWTDEEKAVLQERGQPVLTLNFIKPTIDVVIGLETRVRTDIRVLPRGMQDQALADLMSAAIKFELDMNEAEYVFRQAFEDMVKCGLGWVCVEPSFWRNNTEVYLESVPYDEILIDPMARQYDLTDARYLIRRKWIDIEQALQLFPEAQPYFKRLDNGKWVYAPPVPSYQPSPDEPIKHKGFPDIMGNVKQWDSDKWLQGDEGMVLVWEVLYKTWAPVDYWYNLDTGEIIRVDSGINGGALGPEWIGRTDVMDVIREAILVGNVVVRDEPSQVQIGYYKWVPFWAYRGRKNRFFGLVRQMRDAQADLNKRAIKALHIMNTNQVLVEEGAIDPDQEVVIREEIARPDGFIVLKRDALAQKRIQVLRDTTLAQQQMAIANQRRIEIQETTGVNMEMVGAGERALSGRAIMARQAQGNIILSPLFDNYRRSKRIVATIAAEIIRKNYRPGRFIRIVDDYGRVEPLQITASLNNVRYDIVIGETPYAESQKEIFAAELSNLIRQVTPDIAPVLFKVWLKLVDVPYKDEVLEELDKMAQAQQVQAVMEQDRQALAMDELAKDKALDRLSKFMRIIQGRPPMGRPMSPGVPESEGSGFTQPSDTGLGG